MTQTIVLASNNTGKLLEFSSLLGPLGFDIRTQSALNVPEADEPHVTFIENALAKARHAARLTGLPALADDSGICVAALGNAPGVHSARYAGEPRSDAANSRRLVEALSHSPDRSAYYYCVLVMLRHADDPRPLIGEGRWDGEIVDVPRGRSGFGYDPHFWLPELGRTAAELSPAEKNRMSHRAKALQALLEKLR